MCTYFFKLYIGYIYIYIEISDEVLSVDMKVIHYICIVLL